MADKKVITAFQAEFVSCFIHCGHLDTQSGENELQIQQQGLADRENVLDLRQRRPTTSLQIINDGLRTGFLQLRSEFAPQLRGQSFRNAAPRGGCGITQRKGLVVFFRIITITEMPLCIFAAIFDLFILL